MPDPANSQPEVLRLHIGGEEPRAGWKILNVRPGPHVDFVGDCRDLSRFADSSVADIYASHVFEHLSPNQELPQAFKEVRRVLRPRGLFRLSVPDLDILCRLFLQPQLTPMDRALVRSMMFGGQQDEYDFHKMGFTWDVLIILLGQAGFSSARRVESFNLFQDCSTIRFHGHLISLNVEISK